MNASEYGCGSYHDGSACDNGVRVKRERVEGVLLEKLRRDLLSDKSVQTIMADMQAMYTQRIRQAQAQAAEAPREAQELTAKIIKLRDLQRLQPDMADELQAGIDRAGEKLREIQSRGPASKEAKVLSMLPKAAERARREIAAAMAGDSAAALKARVILRDAFSSEIRLVPEPAGGLVAHWELNSAALTAVGTFGSGGRI